MNLDTRHGHRLAQISTFDIDNVSFYDDEKLALDESYENDWKRRGLYFGPTFIDLDEELQQSFNDFLEERAIGSELAAIIALHMVLTDPYYKTDIPQLFIPIRDLLSMYFFKFAIEQQLGSLARLRSSSSPSSTNNGTSSQASGDQATAHQRPGARSNGQAALPGSASNLTSNTLPSGANSSSSLPNQPSTVGSKTAIIASSVILGALLILGAIMAVLRRKQSKREAMKHHEEEGEAPLRATPGELGKRGTVLIGRGLETSHGLPSSGGWLDNRASESATTPGTLSISASSTSADSNEANLNQT
ncbi:hypothetical protein H4Q26_014038 [Puccinia striiformis f. sp. tritici PST-130]|nr:hypothetical protein H4Q26_014038 [Puccinia striiformis f. sp. tritici PST-130]